MGAQVRRRRVAMVAVWQLGVAAAAVALACRACRVSSVAAAVLEGSLMTPRAEFTLGGTVSFNFTLPAAYAPLLVTLGASSRPALQLPCFNASWANVSATAAVLNCTLLLWSDAWYDAGPTNMTLNITAAGQDSLFVAVPLPPAAPTQVFPQLSAVAPLLAVPGSLVAAALPVHLPPTAWYAAAQLSLPDGCVCTPRAATLRAWFNATASPRCAWGAWETNTAECVVPPLPPYPDAGAGALAATRFTLEVCCAYNVTSDGGAPQDAAPDAVVPGLLTYTPTPAFAAFSPTRPPPAIHARTDAPVNVTVQLPAAIFHRLAALTDAVWLASGPCAGIVWNATQMALECTGWRWPSDPATLPNPYALPLALRIRGAPAVSLSYSAPVRLLPRVLEVLPDVVVPGHCFAVLGRWLAGDDAASVTVLIADGQVPCTPQARVSNVSLKCCFPTVIPSTVPGYPHMSLVVTNNRGASVDAVVVSEPIDAEVNIVYPAPGSELYALPAAYPPPATNATLPPPWLTVAPRINAYGWETARCKLELGAASCPHARASTPPGVALAGSTTIAVQLPAMGAPFTGAAVVGGLGCAASLQVKCTDTLGRPSVAAATIAVRLGNVTLLPAATSGGGSSGLPLIRLPSATLPDVGATLLPDTAALAALGGNVTHLPTLFSCSVVLLRRDEAAGVLATGRNAARSALAVFPCEPAAPNPSASTASVVCMRQRLPPSTPLGVQYATLLQCVYTPSGEVLTIPAADVTLPALDLQLTTRETRAVVSSVSVPTYASVLLGVNVSATGVGAGDEAGGATISLPQAACDWRATTPGGSSVQLGGVTTLVMPPMQLLVAGAHPTPGLAFTLPPLQLRATPGGAADGSGGGLVAVLVCSMWGQVVSSPPLTFTAIPLQVTALAPLPRRVIPSDAPARWLVPEPLVVGVERVGYGTLLQDVVCTLSLAAVNATTLEHLQPAIVPANASTRLADYHSVPANASGAVAFLPFGARAGSEVGSVRASVSCRRPHVPPSVDAGLALAWSLTIVPLAAVLCSPRAIAVVGGESIRVQLSVVGSCGGTAAPERLPPALLEALTAGHAGVPPASCSAVLEVDSGVVRGGVATAAPNGSVEFTQLSVAAPPGSILRLKIGCAAGVVLVPPTGGLTVDATLPGCPRGYQADRGACHLCGLATFSFGGNASMRCAACPAAGATCRHGVLTLLPRFFRPEARRGSPIDASTQLFACFNAEACTLNATAAAADGAGAYGCAPGYTGALCGVCDAAANYASFGGACRLCWSPQASWLVVVGLAVTVVALLGLVAVGMCTQRTDDAIVLRILLVFLQGSGSLRAFTAGSTVVYEAAMGWSDVVSANPFSAGAITCALRWPYLVRLVATVTLPLASSIGVVVIFIALTTVRACSLHPSPSFATHTWRTEIAAMLATRRHYAMALFVLFMTYTPIVASSLRALDCTQPIDGVRYLKADLAVVCKAGDHVVARGVAMAALGIIGVGFPACVAWLLGTATHEQLLDPTFTATWSFLYEGYRKPALLHGGDSGGGGGGRGGQRTAEGEGQPFHRSTLAALLVAAGMPHPPATTNATALALVASTPLPSLLRVPRGQHRASQQRRQTVGDNRVWWEGVVLVRTAGAVLLSALVTNPYLQCMGGMVWYLAFLVAHLWYKPYIKPLFNALEGVTLTACFLTATLSAALLQYSVGAAFAEQHRVDQLTPIEWVVTAFLVALNMGTFILLASAWLWALCSYSITIGRQVYRSSQRGAPRAMARVPVPELPLVPTLPPPPPRSRVSTRMAGLLPPPPLQVYTSAATPVPVPGVVPSPAKFHADARASYALVLNPMLAPESRVFHASALV